MPKIIADPAAHFWRQVLVREPDECWPWQGSLQSQGYGDTRWYGKHELAHRVAYMLGNNLPELPPSSVLILHSCDNRPCCNPAHLREGSHQDNRNDAVARGRTARGERHGMAKLTLPQAMEILILIELGAFTPVELGHLYGVSHQAVYDISQARTWAYLQKEVVNANVSSI